MKKYLSYIIIFFCAIQQFYSQETQEDGVVALNLPVRNSLKFNQYTINPAFSFVRQQHKYLSFTNKREWVQFDDAPQTYLFSYSGRFRENIGLGVGLFQQNYGVLTTFGGVLNYAYNVSINRENNLTFGMNLGFYKSGVNEGNIVTNFSDPSLDNIPSNTLITINPGINYGTEFFDFGVSLPNIVSYNLKTSKIIEENPEQGIQAHIMYTGYMDSRGFFDESKFSTLLKSEFNKETTIISGIVMLTVPKGIWAQVGYNNIYGLSAGLGLNISSQIAIEYNYEKGMGAFSNFGNSHDITLAYKFKNKNRYDYSGDDDEAALIIPKKKTNRAVVKRNTNTSKKVDRQAIAEARVKARAEALEKAEAKAEDRAKLVEEVKAEREALVQENTESPLESETENISSVEAENQAKLAEEAAKAKAEEVAKSKAEEANRLRLAQEAKAKLEQETQQQLAAENTEQEAQAKLTEASRVEAEEAAKAKAEEANRLRLAQEAKAKLEQEAQQQLAAENTEQEAQAKLTEASRIEAEEVAKAKAEEANRLRLAQEAKAKLEQEAQQQLAAANAEQEAQAKLAEVARIEAEEAAKAEEANRLRLAQEAKTRLDQEAQERLAAAKSEEEAKLADAARIKAEEELKTVLPEPTDATTLSMSNLTESAENSNIEQQELLTRLTEAVTSREQDLKDLKEENDLSEQGIFSAPKAFKSVTAENAALESLKTEIDNVIKSQNNKILELETLFSERLKKVPNKNDSVNVAYLSKIQELKSEQSEALQSKERLMATLETIKVATEIERKRRIKRAVYDNEQDKYLKDRAVLSQIKQFTPESTVPLTIEDFDFGEEQSANIQIVKDVKNIESGYYLVLSVHSDTAKRDEFLTKTIAAGQDNIDFFYDVNSSKYFIYYEKFNDIGSAQRAMQSKGSKPYNSKMSMVKIEN